MALLVSRCVLLATVTLITVTGTAIEIYDGNFYGIDEELPPGVSRVSVSSTETDSTIPRDVVIIQPAAGPGNSDQVGLAPGRHHGRPAGGDVDEISGRHGRRRHHHRHHQQHLQQQRGDVARQHHGNQEQGRMFQQQQHGEIMRHHWSVNLTEEQKLNHICMRIQSDAASRDVTDRDQRHHGGMLSWKLQMMNEDDRQKVIDMWNRRKQEMLNCCSKELMLEKTRCVAQMNTARYDRVCHGEEPLCPWAQFMPRPDSSAPTGSGSGAGRRRSGHRGGHHHRGESTVSTVNMTATCCPLQGDERLQCFTEARSNYRQQMYGRMHAGRMSHVIHGRIEDPHRLLRQGEPHPPAGDVIISSSSFRHGVHRHEGGV